MRTAHFSGDRVYRYYLKITWDPNKALVNFLMLNPSTADEVKNDPTVERCERRAKLWGYGGVVITNIFALRSTDPRALYTHKDPVGMLNNHVIIDTVDQSAKTVCAWGRHGKLQSRGESVRGILNAMGFTLHYLKITKDGKHPYHPLYLPYSLKPKVWIGERL